VAHAQEKAAADEAAAQLFAEEEEAQQATSRSRDDVSRKDGLSEPRL